METSNIFCGPVLAKDIIIPILVKADGNNIVEEKVILKSGEGHFLGNFYLPNNQILSLEYKLDDETLLSLSVNKYASDNKVSLSLVCKPSILKDYTMACLDIRYKGKLLESIYIAKGEQVAKFPEYIYDRSPIRDFDLSKEEINLIQMIEKEIKREQTLITLISTNAYSFDTFESSIQYLAKSQMITFDETVNVIKLLYGTIGVKHEKYYWVDTVKEMVGHY